MAGRRPSPRPTSTRRRWRRRCGWWSWLWIPTGRVTGRSNLTHLAFAPSTYMGRMGYYGSKAVLAVLYAMCFSGGFRNGVWILVIRGLLGIWELVGRVEMPLIQVYFVKMTGKTNLVPRQWINDLYALTTPRNECNGCLTALWTVGHVVEANESLSKLSCPKPWLPYVLNLVPRRCLKL